MDALAWPLNDFYTENYHYVKLHEYQMISTKRQIPCSFTLYLNIQLQCVYRRHQHKRSDALDVC